MDPNQESPQETFIHKAAPDNFFLQNKLIFAAIGLVLITALVSSIIIINSKNSQKQEQLTAEQELVHNQPIQNQNAVQSVSLTPTPSSTPTPTTILGDWETYTSNTYGYTLDYPPTWTVANVQQSDPLILEYLVFAPPGYSASQSAITLSYSTRSETQALAINSQQGVPMTVNGMPATQKTIQNSQGVVSIQVIVPDGNNTIIFYAQQQFQAILNDMLSTLEIL